MANKIYKYLSFDVFKMAFTEDGCVTCKFSYPKDYNDPFELFLAIDTKIETQLLAYYKDVVRDLPQFPTTCFSKSPSVPPMWAHYAQNGSGVVVEVDEESLCCFYHDINLDDVVYIEEARPDLVDLVRYAYGTRKPRHSGMLAQAVYSSAYYSKQTCWSYEQERRLVLNNHDYLESGDLMLMKIPKECITGIFTGVKATEEQKGCLQEYSNYLECDFYEAITGKSSGEIYFLHGDGSSFCFDGISLKRSSTPCAICKEPLVNHSADTRLCSWCSITDKHRENAADSNPFRILSEAGLLDGYVERFNNIHS